MKNNSHNGQNWVVKNPNTGNLVPDGPKLRFLSYGVAEAGCFIEDPTTHADPWAIPVHSCNTYHNWQSKAAAGPWMLFRGPANFSMFSSEDYKMDELAAIGHSWWSDAIPTIQLNPVQVWVSFFQNWHWPPSWQDVLQTFTQVFIVPPVNETETDLAFRSKFRRYEHLSMVHQILHSGTGNPIPKCLYQKLLNTAPNCGPYNYGYSAGNASTYEWSSDSRTYDSERCGTYLVDVPYFPPHTSPPFIHHYAGEDKIDSFYGEYNGLDYMLIYNLFHIIEGNKAATVNYMDRDVSLNYPTISGAGNTSNPVVIEGFNSIVASNTIASNTDVTYRAGNEIALLPGFSSTSTSGFHAYIDPFTCSEDGYRNMTLGANDTNQVSPSDNIVAYTEQTSFVNYPKQADETKYNTKADNNKPIVIANNQTVVSKKQITETKPQAVSGVNIVPNPSNGVFQVVITHNNSFIGVKELKIYDVFGKMVWQTGASGNTAYAVDLSAYPNGIYYIHSTNELGEKETKKLVKQ
jgi:hypothetical protein